MSHGTYLAGDENLYLSQFLTQDHSQFKVLLKVIAAYGPQSKHAQSPGWGIKLADQYLRTSIWTAEQTNLFTEVAQGAIHSNRKEVLNSYKRMLGITALGRETDANKLTAMYDLRNRALRALTKWCDLVKYEATAEIDEIMKLAYGNPQSLLIGKDADDR